MAWGCPVRLHDNTLRRSLGPSDRVDGCPDQPSSAVSPGTVRGTLAPQETAIWVTPPPSLGGTRAGVPESAVRRGRQDALNTALRVRPAHRILWLPAVGAPHRSKTNRLLETEVTGGKTTGQANTLPTGQGDLLDYPRRTEWIWKEGRRPGSGSARRRRRHGRECGERREPSACCLRVYIRRRCGKVRSSGCTEASAAHSSYCAGKLSDRLSRRARSTFSLP